MKFRVLMLCFVLAAASLAPYAAAQESIFGLEPPPRVPAPGEADAPAAPETVEDKLAAMGLRAKIAQLMLVTLEGVQGPTATDRAMMDSYTPGGVVVRQFVRPAGAAKYVTALRAVEAKTGVRLLVGANLFELVHRDRGAASEFIQLPSLLSLAAASDDGATERLAKMVAQHMQAMGFTLHLGPSLELAPELGAAKGSIYDFGSDPQFAAEAGAVIFQALQEHGVIPMPMRFPGGGANRDPREAAVLLTPRAQLYDTALRPYIRAIEQGVPMLHVGTTLTPTLDSSSRPACVSSVVLRDLLRQELGFTGVIVAGPMDTEVISSRFDVAEAALLALQNGADMIYWRSAGEAVMRAVDRIAVEVQSGRMPEATIDAALRRVLLLKATLPEVQDELKERKLAQLERDKNLVRESYAVERQAITLVHNRNQVLPLSKERSMPIALTGVVELEAMHEALEKYAKPIAQQRITSARHVGDIEGFEIERLTSRMRNIRTVICVFTDSLRPRGQVELIRAAKARGANVIVVFLGYPEHVPLLAEADAILLAYCDNATYTQTLRAVAEILMGDAPLRIMEAVDDLRARVGESRVYDAHEVARAPAGRLPVTLSPQFPAGLAVPYDPTQAIRRVQWDFGDGKRSRDSRIDHAFQQPGRYPVTLNVTDSKGETYSHVYHVLVE